MARAESSWAEQVQRTAADLEPVIQDITKGNSSLRASVHSLAESLLPTPPARANTAPAKPQGKGASAKVPASKAPAKD